MARGSSNLRHRSSPGDGQRCFLPLVTDHDRSSVIFSAKQLLKRGATEPSMQQLSSCVVSHTRCHRLRTRSWSHYQVGVSRSSFAFIALKHNTLEGHAKPLCALACKLVMSSPSVVITLLTVPTLIDRCWTEISRGLHNVRNSPMDRIRYILTIL